MKLFNLPEKSNREGKPRLPLHVYFSYLLVLTLVFTGVSFSRYATSAEASASARVAKFSIEIDASQEDEDINLVLDETKTGPSSYSFTVTSDSEVAVKDQVTVTLPGALPEGVNMTMTLTVDGEETDCQPTIDETLNAYKYSADFEPGPGAHMWTLTFAAEDLAAVDAQELEGITIAVDAEQID